MRGANKPFFYIRNGIKKSVDTVLEILILLFGKTATSSNSILLIQTNAIGDYLLFRNYIKILKNHPKYSNHKVYLLGNSVFKELATTYDHQFIEKFFWINNKKLWESRIYQHWILLKLSFYSFQMMVNSSYSRNFLVDESLIAKIKANQKIGFKSDFGSSKPEELAISDKYYTTLIPADKETKFEFDRNKEFFEKLLNSTIIINRPSIEPIKTTDHLKKYKDCIIIFPGARQLHKQWGAENFSEVIKHLLKNTSKLILIAGSKDDSFLARQIIDTNNDCSRIIDLTGQTSLPDLIELISLAEILISNDTVAVHIAAAVGARVISILNGQHYGRFCPYPNNSDVFAIYPPAIEAMGIAERMLKYKYESDADIKTITPDRVIEIIQMHKN